MTPRLIRLWLIAFLIAFIGSKAAFGQSGVLIRPDTTSSSVPSPNSNTFVFSNATGSGYWYNGTAFVQVTAPISNYLATTAPGTGNDNTQGYGVGSIWLNTSTNNYYIARSVATGAANWQLLVASTGQGTVTSVSAGTLSPLFTTSVSTSTTTPALAFALTNAAAGTIFGNFTGSTGAPSYNTPGAADTILGKAHTGSGLEYKTVSAGSGITITPSAGAITIANAGVTSVGLSVPSFLTVSGSPITTSGTFAVSANSQAQNTVYCGPASGGSGTPGFRALVAADFGATQVVPYGTIIAWWSTDTTIPTGWALCNGQTTNWQTGPFAGNSVTLPNLIGMFIQGADMTGGSSTANGSGFGSQANQSTFGSTTHTHTYSGNTGTPSATSSNSGGNPGAASPTHTHAYSGTTASSSTQPACYAIVYLIKL